MTNDTLTTSKALKIAENMQMVDSKIISKIFKKIKKKGILKEPIEIKIEKKDMQLFNSLYNEGNLKIQFNDFIDQFIYYRKLRGYTQEQVGQVIGISGKSYYKYEKRIHQLKDINKINMIAEFLNVGEVKMPTVRKRIDNHKLKEYLIDNNINNSEFSRLIGVSRRSILDWFNKGKGISEDSCKKIEDFIKVFEANKSKQEEIEDEMEEYN